MFLVKHAVFIVFLSYTVQSLLFYVFFEIFHFHFRISGWTWTLVILRQNKMRERKLLFVTSSVLPKTCVRSYLFLLDITDKSKGVTTWSWCPWCRTRQYRHWNHNNSNREEFFTPWFIILSWIFFLLWFSFQFVEIVY